MTPFEFGCMTLGEYVLKMRGFSRARSREWEHTRFIGHIVETTKPGVKVKPITQWMPLPTDSQTGALTEEQMINDWMKAVANGKRVKNTD